MRIGVFALWLSVAMGLPLPVAHAQPRIPLVKDLVVVSAVQRQEGDFEVVETVSDASADSIDFTVALAKGGKDVNGLKDGDAFTRTVRRTDLRNAHRINAVLQSGDPSVFPGSTYTQVSAEVLQELKTKGESAAVLGWSPVIGTGNMMMTLLQGGRKYYRGALKRVEGPAASVKVLVNGKSVALPAVHARGQLSLAGESDVVFDAWWLDDAENALQLRVQMQNGSSSQVVRIDFPMSQDVPQATLRSALARGECRAELHGVYFDTASARLLPASKATIAEIAKLLRDESSWSITVEGHADNVGGAEYNLDLSRRRANAVRDALTKGLGIDLARIRADGLGLTRPVDSNDTLEGRAHNRRVELSRNCH